jgi:hypothetical protein
VLSGRLSAATLGFDRPADAFQPAPDGFHLADDPPQPSVAAGSEVPVPPPPPRLFDPKTTRVTAAVLIGAPIVGYFAWWHTSSRSSFEVANERWFQRDTYAGGADKASHIFLGYISTLALQGIYRSLDKTPAQARGLALGVMVVAGALVEMGDGFSKYGFSWEDIAANAIGATLATGLDAWGLKDTVGLRFGLMETPTPPPCCAYGGYGDDYSKEIYTFDLKLAGLLPRLGAKPGVAKFLLVSGTYQSKGYRYSPPENRRREIGIEVGLNVREILVAVGVPETRTWGKILLALATYFRIPYTGWGWRYDLNSGTWTGPNSGHGYDAGLVIYD